MRIIMVTGMSGAGKSTALKCFEDMGFEVVDNVPLTILPTLATGGSPNSRGLVVGADVRSRDFSASQFVQALRGIYSQGPHSLEILFFDCDDDVLHKRFTETRRKHPLAQDRPVADGIQSERHLLRPLASLVDTVIDSTDLPTATLKQLLLERYGDEDNGLSLHLMSFAFKRGVPREADLMFDVRFLRNPHYDEALRPLTGLVDAVGAYVEADEDFSSFFENLCHFLLPLLPRYYAEGKQYLTIAIGCTGGQHRSVYVTQKLAGFLEQKGYKVGIRHRDIPS